MAYPVATMKDGGTKMSDGTVVYKNKAKNTQKQPVKGPVALGSVKNPLPTTNAFAPKKEVPKLNLFDFSTLAPVSKIAPAPTQILGATGGGMKPPTVISKPLPQTPRQEPKSNPIFGVTKANAGEDVIGKFYNDTSIDDDKKQMLSDAIDQGMPRAEVEQYLNKEFYGEAPVEEQGTFKEYLPMARAGAGKFTVNEDDNPFETVGKTIGNIPGGIYNLGAGAVNLGANLIQRPIDTTKEVVKGVAGAVKSGAEAVQENYKQGFIKGTDKTLGQVNKLIGENPVETLGIVKPKVVAKATGKILSPGTYGTGLKTVGKSLYKTAIKPNTQEAQLLLRSKAGLGATPVTRADTALKAGIKGTETRIGVQALRKADEIFKAKIAPVLEKSKETHKIDNLFSKVKEEIMAGKEGELRKQDLLKGLQALEDDYKSVKKKEFTTKDLQSEKSSLDEFTPQKIFKGQDVANGYNQVKNMLANKMREAVRDDLAKSGLPNAKELYRDYANLTELSKVGIKGLTDAGFKGGFGGFWTTFYEQATTPVKTIGGEMLYRVGDKLEFVGPKGIKTVGDFLKNKFKIDKEGVLTPNKGANVNNNLINSSKNTTGNAKSILKPKK